ncbi:MAG: acyltransferase domain-containing protein [Clostridia bacterium]|nr:acyltransferase domain-containing protein [Clostridia bacterium]
MKKPIVFMFSGQGAQYYNMGRELFLMDSAFRGWMKKLDEMYQDMTGESVIKVLYDEKRMKIEVFSRLRYTHPAIFILEYSIAKAVMERGIYPQYVLGASLGEFVSAAISGVMSCEDALECVVKQAEAMEKHCENGGMLAIINDTKIFEEEPVLYQNSELVSVNYHSHFVVCGSLSGLEKIERYLKAKVYVFQRLPVSYAFHSSMIDPAGFDFKEFIKTKPLSSPRVNFVSCLTGGREESVDYGYFWDVVRKPINFISAVKEIEKMGECIYIDMGPSGTLANFAKYNLGSKSLTDIYSIITPFNNEKNLIKLVEAVVV